MKALGPHGGSTRFSGAQGIGSLYGKVDPAWVGFVGQAGDVEAVSSGDLHSGQVQQGYGLQAIGAPVKVAFSCANPTLIGEAGTSTNADLWCNEVTVTPGTITFVDNVIFTMLRFTFSADAEIYIVTR